MPGDHCGIPDPERETSLEEVLAALEISPRRFQAALRAGGVAEVIDQSVSGARVTLMPTASSPTERSPDPREAAIFVELAEQLFERFRPDVLLTYGGHPPSLELVRRARQRRMPSSSTCTLRLNDPNESGSEKDRRAFAEVSAVIFPSEYSRSHYARLLGLDGPVIPDPISLDRIVSADPEPKHVTFINPQPSKCVKVFVRIATAGYRVRPDLPLLIGLMPQFNAAFDIDNRKTGLTPRSPL